MPTALLWARHQREGWIGKDRRLEGIKAHKAVVRQVPEHVQIGSFQGDAHSIF